MCTLGQPLLAHDSVIVCLHFSSQANYTAPRIVVAAAGVDHEEFKAAAEPLFADLPAVAAAGPPLSQYVGGDWRMAADSPVSERERERGG